MRLIDADKLPFEEVCIWESGTFKLTTGEIVDGKAIREAPTVEAIPVERIKKYMDKIDKEDCGMVYLSPSGPFRDMLKEWEK